MRFASLLLSFTFFAPLATAQDSALQIDSSLSKTTISFPWKSVMATGLEFTAEAWVRMNPNCISGSTCLFSRVDATGAGEDKYLCVDADGTVRLLYAGSIDNEVFTPPGAVPNDEQWHHVSFTHRTDAQWIIHVDGSPVLNGQGKGYPIYFSAGVDTKIGDGTGWQISEIRISDTDRYLAGSFVPDETLGGDSNAILLLHFDEGSGTTVSHDSTTGNSTAQTGTISGYAYWISGQHGDTDMDGAGDDSELAAGTLLFDQDTDDDGISDGVELASCVDPLNLDTDGDGLQDGTETGRSGGQPGDSTLCIDGTDLNLFIPDGDRGQTTTDPCDDDSDDDGLLDGTDEDANGDGVWRLGTGETDPNAADTDRDGIQDGTEQSLTSANGSGTDPSVFVPDADPSTYTDPLNPDTDGGGIKDGNEDINGNGALDLATELDPTKWGNWDDLVLLTNRTNTWQIGGPVYLDVSGCFPGAMVAMMYGFNGYGQNYFSGMDITLVLQKPVFTLPAVQMANANGDALFFEWLPNNPGLVGVRIYLQAIEQTTEAGYSPRYRPSNADDRQIQ